MEEHPTQLDSEGEPILAICGRWFPFDDSGIDFSGTTLVIKEVHNNQSASAGNDGDTQSASAGNDGDTAFNVWDGALLMARYLEKSPELVINKTILELGSGCK